MGRGGIPNYWSLASRDLSGDRGGVSTASAGEPQWQLFLAMIIFFPGYTSSRPQHRICLYHDCI